ncbi:MAG: putative ABC transporter permease [Lachnospiraceae bacterium]|nr:putative ABC transporter permease [Lachnospiraceae bacterium]
MIYSLRDLVWLFFVYSFAGWCTEVCYAAFIRRKFVNRGFVNSPYCTIYGFSAVLFAVFLAELADSAFFLFLGGLLLASLVEYTTGMLMEKIFHRKLWDYSDIRYNLSGYVCARYSLLWGLLAVATVRYVNPLLCSLLRGVPDLVTLTLQWAAAGLLAIDFITTSMAVLGMQVSAKRLSQLSEGMQHTSKLLENRLTVWVQKRMQRSFPSINPETIAADLRAKSEQAKSKPAVFAKGCSFYKLVSLFFVGAFLGDITETIFCFLTTGVLMSRSSVVYGPFSIVWGLGCALLTLFLYRYRNKTDRYIFLAGTLLGGVYEYVCSVFTELFFGTVFWDYSGFAFNLGGRINLLYCFFWGIAAVVWLKIIYPKLSDLIERLPVRAGRILCNCLIVFMIVNMILSSLALARYTQRQTNGPRAEASGAVSPDAEPEDNPLASFLDAHFPDERMERIYPNAKLVD